MTRLMWAMVNCYGTTIHNAQITRLAMAIAIMAVPASAQEEIRSIAGRVRPSVVTVVAYDGAGGVAASGLGFFVRESGLLLTRACLFRSINRAEIKTADGTSYALTKLVGIDSGQSLAILAADIGSATVKPIAISISAPRVGEEVFFYADTSLSERSLAKGRITDNWRTTVGRVIEVGGPPSPIPVGNPVFNSKGEVVGVASAFNSTKGTFLANAGDSLEKLDSVAKSAASSSSKSTKSLGEQFRPYVNPQKPVMLQGTATKQVAPSYPEAARALFIAGQVVVQITVNEKGKVISTRMITGHPVFKDESEAVARRWEFVPTLLCGLPIKGVGTISFNFNR